MSAGADILNVIAALRLPAALTYPLTQRCCAKQWALCDETPPRVHPAGRRDSVSRRHGVLSRPSARLGLRRRSDTLAGWISIQPGRGGSHSPAPPTADRYTPLNTRVAIRHQLSWPCVRAGLHGLTGQAKDNPNVTRTATVRRRYTAWPTIDNQFSEKRRPSVAH